MIRLLFVDDHALFRHGLQRLLLESGRVTIVGECSTGTEALSEIKRLLPDVALLDISLPDISGISLVSSLRAEGIQTPLIMLTMHDDPIWCRRALTAGANGYLLKDDAFVELTKAVYSVLDGRQYISRRLLQTPDVPASGTHSTPLTIREREILRLISMGKTNRKIAEELAISIKTVDTHRTRLMKKLNLHTAVELARYAVDLGLV